MNFHSVIDRLLYILSDPGHPAITESLYQSVRLLT